MKSSFLLLIFSIAFLATSQVQSTEGNKEAQIVDSQTVAEPVKDKDSSSQIAEPEKKTVEIIESEEELILDGGEEDLLGSIKPQEKEAEKADSAAISSEQVGKADSAETVTEQLPEGSSDQVKKPAQSDSPVTEANAPVQEKSEPVVAKVEKMQPINFARNLTEYRSPKLAIMLSLLLPGLGQSYAHNGKKAVLYGAVEAAVVGVGVGFAVKGRSVKNEANKFADQHYSAGNFKSYLDKLKNHFSDSIVYDHIFLGSDPDTFVNVNVKNRDETYYRTIRDADLAFVHGWDDAEPGLNDNFEIEPEYESVYSKHLDPEQEYLFYRKGAGDDTSKAMYGFSENQKKYSDQISRSNGHYRTSKGVLTLLLVNHIVSAIDAGITAKAYNDQLLGKQSFWQRINIKEQSVATGNGTATGYALQVRF